MRCLTLAETLRECGAEIQFICRTQTGNLIELIRSKKFIVHELRTSKSKLVQPFPVAVLDDDYNSWLGTSQEQDSIETIRAFQGKIPDWLIVDHYSLGEFWETKLCPHVSRIMVIDDLADRPHNCDLLLNQNYLLDGESSYKGLLPSNCKTLLGPLYALLRPEFAEARKHLKKRSGKVRTVLIFFGGVDPNNFTGIALEALSFPEFRHLGVEVVLGSHNLHFTEIENKVEKRFRTKLHVQIKNMAELMAQTDLAIGAGGGATWERLCLGIPSIVVTVAKNQIPSTEYLDKDGYLNWLGTQETVDVQKLRLALRDTLEKISVNRLQSSKGMKLVSENGSSQVAKVILQGD